MSVKSVKPWMGDHEAHGDFSNATATLWHTVDCTPGTYPWEAEAGVGWVIGQGAPNDPRQRVVSSFDTRVIPDSNIAYRIGVNFTLNKIEAISPLERIFRPSLTFEETREPIYVDGDGLPIVSSVGTSFDPPIETPVRDAVITLVQNVSKLNTALAKASIGAVNTDPIFGAAAGELKITGWETQPLTENGFDYYQDTIRITQRENRTIGSTQIGGWFILVLDESRYQVATDVDTSGGSALLIPSVKQILDASGEPVADPVPLDGRGFPITSTNKAQAGGGGLFVNAPDNNSVFRMVKPRKLISYGALNLKFKT